MLISVVITIGVIVFLGFMLVRIANMLVERSDRVEIAYEQKRQQRRKERQSETLRIYYENLSRLLEYAEDREWHQADVSIAQAEVMLNLRQGIQILATQVDVVPEGAINAAKRYDERIAQQIDSLLDAD